MARRNLYPERQSHWSIIWEGEVDSHDLRRTAATLARRLVFPAIVRALLAHTEKDVTAIYDRYEMLPEKRNAVLR